MWKRILILIDMLLALFVACRFDDGAHRAPGQSLDACRREAEALMAEVKKGLPVDQVLVRLGKACSGLYVEKPCRDAFEGMGKLAPDQRLVALARTCRDAYCPLLPEPKPPLCQQRSLPDSPQALAVYWQQLHRAILTRDLGPDVARALAPGFERLWMALQPITVTLPAKAPEKGATAIVLRVRLGPDAVSVQGAGLDLKLAPGEKLDGVEALRKAVTGRKEKVQVIIEATNALPYRIIVQAMDELSNLGLTDLALSTPAQRPRH